MCRGVSGVSETGLLAGLGIWPMRSDLEWKRTYHSRKEKGSVENVLGRYLLNSCLLGQAHRQSRVVETVVQEVMERGRAHPLFAIAGVGLRSKPGPNSELGGQPRTPQEGGKPITQTITAASQGLH